MNAVKRQMMERHLATAERHVAEGELVLEHQRAMIEHRLAMGLDVGLATELLGEMEYTQCLHVGERDRLRRELRAPDAPA